MKKRHEKLLTTTSMLHGCTVHWELSPGLKTQSCHKSVIYVTVVCGLGPSGARPHNRHYLRHCGREQPRLGWTATVESNTSVCFKRLLLTAVSSCSSRQTQGVVGVALNRRRELQVLCAASALRSSAEAASSVLSASPESWIAWVGRANSSTRHPPTFQNLLTIGKQIYGRQGSETKYRNQKQSEKHKGPVNLTM